ncbi:hypothetical protein TNCV_2418911 [Trichonephila clavipes]|nr:hypothetical protein TNCV_2418911 [Trichonephila clavipes]
MGKVWLLKCSPATCNVGLCALLTVTVKLSLILETELAHRLEDLTQALISYAGIPLYFTGRVYRKSPANKTTIPPTLSCKSLRVRFNASITFLLDIILSTHSKSLDCRSNLPRELFLLKFQIGEFSCARFNGNFKTKCAVQPPVSSVSAIPNEAPEMLSSGFF